MLRRAVVRVIEARAFCTAVELKDARPFSEVPTVPGIPILGSAYTLLPIIGKYKLTAVHHATEDKFKRLGPIFKESFTKDEVFLFLFDVEDFQKVFRNEGRLPERRAFVYMKKYRDSRKDIYLNPGLINSQGEEWYETRSEVQPHMMKVKAIRPYLGDLDQVSQQLVSRTKTLARQNNGEAKDLLSELYKWALESIGVIALDARFGCLEQEMNKEAADMIRMVNDMFGQMLQLEFSPIWRNSLINGRLYRRFNKNMDDFSKIVIKYLDRARKRLEGLADDHEPTFLDLLIRTTKDPRIVTTMVVDMFFAGIDTTSTTVGLTLYHLARNPEIQEKAHKEAKEILDKHGMTVECLNEAKYIKACVKESLRLTPIVSGILRKLPQDTVLGGYVIPAGTNVVLDGYVTGRLESNYRDPLEFRPERFLRENITHDPFAFLPFGFGPRSCIGRRIAEQEMWTLLIRILTAFRLEFHGGEIDLETRFINTPNKPLDFKIFER